MNKIEYGEFHKYLAYLIYEYNKSFCEPNLTEECKTEIGENITSIRKSNENMYY